MMSLPWRLALSTPLALTCILAGSAGAALAHAQYSGSSPAASSTVQSVPSVLRVTYTQELSDAQIAVTGPDGSNVTTGLASFDLANRHNASVPMRDAGPGLYTVIWHNVSGDDGDPNDGTFVFTEVGPAPAQGAAPSTPVSPPGGSQAAATGTQAAAPALVMAAVCVDNGKKTPGINDVRAETYCERQAIRDLFKGKIDISGLNYALATGEGLESALSDSCTVSADQCVLPKGFGLRH